MDDNDSKNEENNESENKDNVSKSSKKSDFKKDQTPKMSKQSSLNNENIQSSKRQSINKENISSSKRQSINQENISSSKRQSINQENISSSKRQSINQENIQSIKRDSINKENISSSKRQSKNNDNISEFSKKSKLSNNNIINNNNDNLTIKSDTSELILDNLSQKYSQDKFNSEQLFQSNINKISNDEFNYLEKRNPEMIINKSIKNFNEISKEEKEKNDYVNNLKNHYFINAKDTDNLSIEEIRKQRIIMNQLPELFDNKDIFTSHDLIIPNGKNAKLILINEPNNKNLKINEILELFNIYEPTPIINLIGANTKNKGKLLSGISRAAFNSKAIIIDSGIQNGIERFCLRKNLTLIGIAPENKIEYPKLNNNTFNNTCLTNGHSHFILLGNDEKKLEWGNESKFKVNFIEKIIQGKKGVYNYNSKCVGIIFGNIPNCVDECLLFIERNWPLIIIEDSEFSQMIKEIRNREVHENKYGDKIKIIGKYHKLIDIEDDSENLASAIHICLTVSF